MLHVSAPTVCVFEVIILSGRVYGVMGLLTEDHLIL